MARRKIIHWVSTGDAAVTTVGVASATVCQFDLSSLTESPDGVASNGCAISVDATVLGYSTAGTTDLVVNRQIQASFKRTSSVISTIAAQVPTIIGVSAALAGAVTNIDNPDNNIIRCRVTGVAAITIDWFCDMRIRIYQPS